MASFLTDAANAVARNPNKPTKAEIEAYIGNVMDSLRSLPSVDHCLLGYDVSMFTDLLGENSYVWRETLILTSSVEITALRIATNFKPMLEDGNLMSLEISYPCSPTSNADVEIKVCFDPCEKNAEKRAVRTRPLNNDEARYVNVCGTWSERDTVLREFARLLIEFGSPAVSKALRPIEVPVNVLEDALRTQPR